MVAVSHDHGIVTNIHDVGAGSRHSECGFSSDGGWRRQPRCSGFPGTPTGGNAQDPANFTGEWHLYIAHTYDGGATWTLVDATPTDPVQRGSICCKAPAAEMAATCSTSLTHR